MTWRFGLVLDDLRKPPVYVLAEIYENEAGRPFAWSEVSLRADPDEGPGAIERDLRAAHNDVRLYPVAKASDLAGRDGAAPGQAGPASRA